MKASWLYLKKDKFVLIIADIISLTYIINKHLINLSVEYFNNLFIVNIFLIISLLGIGYVANRYSIYYFNRKNIIYSSIRINSIIIIILFTLILSFIYFWNFNLSSFYIKNFLFKIFLYLLLSQITFVFFSKNCFLKRIRCSILIYKDENLDIIKNEFKKTPIDGLSKVFENNLRYLSFNDFKKLELKSLKKNHLIFDNIQNLNSQEIKLMTKENIHFTELKTWFEQYFQRVILNSLNKANYDYGNIVDNKIFEFRIKRTFDILFSILLLICLSPLCLIIAVIIKIEDNNNIFYSQFRNGKGLKKISIRKFRSMKIDAEKEGPKWSLENDNRVTKFGKFIRKLRLDEIPQLLSVIKGDMSLIGPRPERPEMDKIFLKQNVHYDNRYSIKPGLSGWAQVNYPYGASFEDGINKLSYDIYYLDNFSLLLDAFIFVKTIKIIFNLKGSR